MADIDVRVYKTSDGEFHVFPPVVALKQGVDNLNVINSSDEDLAWNAPAGAFNNTDPDGDFVGKGKSKKGANKAATKGAYSYAVFMLGSGKKAKGNSDPMIIVE